jgi:hypothetical protein
MRMRLGAPFFVALAAGILVLAASFFADLWNWFMSVVAAILLSTVAFVLFVYFARLRAAEGFFDKGGEPVVTFQFDENGVRTESDLGSVDMKWEAFDEILMFPDLWLLVYAKSGYMTLPLDQLTSECRDFIEMKVGSTKQ